MSPNKEAPPRGAAAGLPLEMSFHSRSDNPPHKAPARQAQPEISRNPRAVREAKCALQLEFLHECAGGIRVHAELVQTFAEIGDTVGVCYALKRLFAQVKAAHPIYYRIS